MYNKKTIKKIAKLHVDYIMKNHDLEMSKKDCTCYQVYFYLFYRAILLKSELFTKKVVATSTDDELKRLLIEHKMMIMTLLDNFRDLKLVMNMFNNHEQDEHESNIHLNDLLRYLEWKGEVLECNIIDQDHVFVMRYSQINTFARKAIESL